MKKLRKLLILLLVLVLCVGAYFAVTYFNKDPEPIAMEEIAVYTAETDDLAKLSWDYLGQTTTLIQSDGVWTVEADPDFPLDQSYAKVMATRLHNLVALSTLQEFDTDPATYGLDEPVCVIRATTKDGQTTTLSIGSFTSTVGGYYLTNDQTPAQLYIVEENVLTAFKYNLYDLVKKESIPSMSSIISLDVADGDNQFSVRYFEDSSGMAYTDEYSWFTMNADGSYSAASINKIVDLASNLANLSWQKCVAYQASEEELASYGLDEETAARISMGYLDDQNQEQTFTLLFGNYENTSCYTRIEGSQMVYLVDASIVDPLLVANADTVAPDDICLMNWDSVTAMDVTLDGQTVTIDFEGTQETTSIDGETTQQSVYRCNGEALDSTAVDAILDSLHSMQATDTVTDSAARGQAVSFTFHRNTESYEEMTLTFYQYNSGSYLVTFTDQPNRLVNSSDVSTLLTQTRTVLSAVG